MLRSVTERQLQDENRLEFASHLAEQLLFCLISRDQAIRTGMSERAIAGGSAMTARGRRAARGPGSFLPVVRGLGLGLVAGHYLRLLSLPLVAQILVRIFRIVLVRQLCRVGGPPQSSRAIIAEPSALLRNDHGAPAFRRSSRSPLTEQGRSRRTQPTRKRSPI